MPKISRGDVKHIAKLAHLQIPEDDLPLYTKQIESIVDYIDQFDTTSASQTSLPTLPVEENKAHREDIPHPSDLAQKLLSQAPLSQQGLFSVPKVSDSWTK